MTTPTQSLGKWGETQAADYLEKRGYQILGRNVRTPYGEFDLIASLPGQDRQDSPSTGENNPAPRTIIFVEVKTRASKSLGNPEISVSSRKQSHLINAALYYMQQHELPGCTWRIDVIAIARKHLDEPPEIVHFENAIGM